MSPLHITNGDCAAGTLRTFLTDRVIVTCDVLHDGPAPLVDDDAWYETRARFLTDGFGAPYEATRASLAQFDRMVAHSEDEIVLWFEHDLFDQLLLIRTLGVIRGRERPGVSLICIDRFPGVERFIGLGQLTGDQLASLYPARQPVGAAHFALASDAWRAFRASDPRELFNVMVRLRANTPDDAHAAHQSGASGVASGFSRTDSLPLPFLADAIRRLFEEYPSTANGLSRSAHAVLRELATGPLAGIALFVATQRDEPRPFMGDTGLFDVIRGLAAARVPLVTIDGSRAGFDLRPCTMRLTDAGRSVLDGRADAIALNGIDEWRGGVHLAGQDRSPWRWDAAAETLVS